MKKQKESPAVIAAIAEVEVAKAAVNETADEAERARGRLQAILSGSAGRGGNNVDLFECQLAAAKAKQRLAKAMRVHRDTIVGERLAAGDPDALACEPKRVHDALTPLLAAVETASAAFDKTAALQAIDQIKGIYSRAIQGQRAFSEKHGVSPWLPVLQGTAVEQWHADLAAGEQIAWQKFDGDIERLEAELSEELAMLERKAREQEQREELAREIAAERAQQVAANNRELARQAAARETQLAKDAERAATENRELARANRIRRWGPEGTPSLVIGVDADGNATDMHDPRRGGSGPRVP